MLYDNLPLSMPWYSGIGLQDRFRQNVAQDAVVTQLAPYDGLIPFQLRKPSSSTRPVTWKIKCCSEGISLQEYLDGYEDTDRYSFSTLLINFLLNTSSFVDPDEPSEVYDYLIFRHEGNDLLHDTFAADGGLESGVYYMEMDFGIHDGGKWYSETFRVPQDRFSFYAPSEDCNYPIFKWSHNSDLRQIHYHDDAVTPFFNLLYLDTFITASEPIYEVQGEPDGLNEFHPTFEKISTKYRVSCVVPDYIKIALFVMQLHDNRYLFTEKGLRQGEMKNLEISSTLSSDGAHSFVEILCEQVSLFVKTGCPTLLGEPDPYEIAGTPTLYTEFCNATGAIFVHITTPLPTGIFGSLLKKVGGFYVTSIIDYISRDAMLAGFNGTIDPGSGATEFKVVFNTFSFTVGESTESIPVASC